MQKSVELITHYEGFSRTPYLCPAGVRTIGYGRTTGSMGVTYKEKELKWLSNKLLTTSVKIKKLTGTMLDHEIWALTSFVYNVGFGAFTRSTLLQKIQHNDPEASAEILRWTKANNRRLEGLAKRRASEFALYTTGKLILL